MDRGLRVEKGQKESRHLGSGQTGAEVLQVSVCDHGMGELGLSQIHKRPSQDIYGVPRDGERCPVRRHLQNLNVFFNKVLSGVEEELRKWVSKMGS